MKSLKSLLILAAVVISAPLTSHAERGLSLTCTNSAGQSFTYAMTRSAYVEIMTHNDYIETQSFVFEKGRGRQLIARSKTDGNRATGLYGCQ